MLQSPWQDRERLPAVFGGSTARDGRGVDWPLAIARLAIGDRSGVDARIDCANTMVMLLEQDGEGWMREHAGRRPPGRA
jgi:hypothetical protein